MNGKDLRLLRVIRDLGTTEGRFTLTEVAKKLGISHVAVGKRLKRLLERGEYRLVPEINLSSMGFKVALVRVEAPSYQELDALREVYQRCPRVIWIMEALGGFNLNVLMYAENDHVLKSILSCCSIRARPEVRRSEVEVGELTGGFAPIFPPTGEGPEITPCGVNCSECKRYAAGECIGCPATRHYRPPV